MFLWNLHGKYDFVNSCLKSLYMSYLLIIIEKEANFLYSWLVRVRKFVRDLGLGGGFGQVLQFPPQLKLASHDSTAIRQKKWRNCFSSSNTFNTTASLT